MDPFCKGQVSWRARYDTTMCRSLRVQLDNFAFEFATFSAVSRIPGAGVMEGTLR